MKNIKKVIKEGKGLAAEGATQINTDFQESIASVKEEVTDLATIFQDYIKEMTNIIAPKDKNKMTQVDEEDIAGNIQSIKFACEAVWEIGENTIGYAIDNNNDAGLGYEPDVKGKLRRNGAKLEQARNEFRKAKPKFEFMMGRLDKLYKKVEEYENLDDLYGYKSLVLHDKYTDIWEGFGDQFDDFCDNVKSFALGVWDALVDIVKGVKELLKLTFWYPICGVFVNFGDLIGADSPDFMKGYYDSVNNTASYIVTNPGEVVDGIIEGASDAIAEKGWAYCFGYIAANIAVGKVTSKGVGKLKTPKGVTKSTVLTLDDYARMVSSVDELIAKGVKTLDDLINIGVNSVDDLARVGITSMDDLARFGITTEEQLAKLGITKADDLASLGYKGGSGTINGLKIIDGKVDGKIPIKEYEELRKISIHNSNSDSMTLGKYFDGSIKSGSYVAKAETTGDTYFSLGNEWDKIKHKYKLSEEDMFEFFNKAALDDAVSQGKQIRFSQDPRAYGDCSLKNEWEYLKNKYSYKQLKKIGDYWYAK